MKRISFISILSALLLYPAANAQDTWVAVEPGLELLKGMFVDHGESTSFVLVRCNPKKYQVQIIDTFHELKRANAYAAYSLEEVKAKTGAYVVANAGSTASYSLPAPTGLLQVGGKVLSRLSQQAQAGGVLCINRERISIVGIADAGRQSCIDAVQRGPYLSRESASTLHSTARERRTAAAVDSDGNLLILVTRDGITLSSLASFLYTSKLNLNVQAALNLDGGESSGLLAGGRSSEVTMGSTDVLVASAIAINKKR